MHLIASIYGLPPIYFADLQSNQVEKKSEEKKTEQKRIISFLS